MQLVHIAVSYHDYDDADISSMKLKKRRFPSNDSFVTSSTSSASRMTPMIRISQRHRRRHDDKVILFLAIWIIYTSISSFETTSTTAWQILTLPPQPPPTLFPSLLAHRRYDSSCIFRNPNHRFRYGPDITTTTMRFSSSSNNNINDSFDMDETDVAMTVTTTTNHDSTDTDTTTATTATSTTNNNNSNMIPANLRRKIQAKRPTLGHVVPYQYKLAQQQQQQQQSSSSSSGGSIPSQLRLQGRRGNTNAANSNINPNPNQNKHTNYLIQIMAGIARGRKLESPSTVYLRPMMGKVKEAIYSTLTSFGIYNQNQNTNIPIRHLDIFAGSGSVGLESLSRGATHCTFVDFSIDCCQCIQRNIDLTGLGTTTTSTSHPNNYNIKDTTTTPKSTLVCCADAMTALINPTSIGIPPSIMPYQIITICPPYEEVIYGDLLEAVVGSDTVTEDTIVIVEYPIELLQPPRRSNKNNKKDNNDTSSSSLPHPNNPATNENIYYGMPHVIQSKTNTAIGIRNRKYGRTVMAFYIINPTGRYPDANSRPEEFVQPV